MKYTVRTKFVFEGEFYIEADSKEKAKEHVLKDCGLCIGGNIHSSLPEDMVDWNFCVHPDKVVTSIRRKENK